MVESSTYYRAYQPFLEIFQTFQENDIPFANVLVYGKQEENEADTVDIADTFLVSETKTMDRAQLHAVNTAINNNVVIIQGPPGDV
jgi:peptide subunit release factor 1 (eRF1)